MSSPTASRPPLVFGTSCTAGCVPSGGERTTRTPRREAALSLAARPGHLTGSLSVYCVRSEGLEPSRPRGHTDLNRARMPFRHKRLLLVRTARFELAISTLATWRRNRLSHVRMDAWPGRPGLTPHIRPEAGTALAGLEPARRIELRLPPYRDGVLPLLLSRRVYFVCSSQRSRVAIARGFEAKVTMIRANVLDRNQIHLVGVWAIDPEQLDLASIADA